MHDNIYYLTHIIIRVDFIVIVSYYNNIEIWCTKKKKWYTRLGVRMLDFSTCVLKFVESLIIIWSHWVRETILKII